MSLYLLDTNILSYWEDTTSPHYPIIKNKILSLNNDDFICVSILSLYEFQFSANGANQDKKENILKTVETIKELFEIIPLDVVGSEIYGELKYQYKEDTGFNKEKLKKDTVDLIIASSAIEKKATVVSNDSIFPTIGKFRNDLKFENWTQ